MSKSILSWGTLVASVAFLPNGEIDDAEVLEKAQAVYQAWKVLNKQDLSEVQGVLDQIFADCNGARVAAPSLRNVALSRLGMTETVQLTQPALVQAMSERIKSVLSGPRYRSHLGKHGGISRRTDEQVAFFVANGKDAETPKPEPTK